MAMYDADGQQVRADSDDWFDGHNAVVENLGLSQSADDDMRDMAREAHLFVDKRDGQWEPFWWSSNAARPRYSFDMTSPIIDQVTSEISRASFDIRVQPAGGSATKDIALTYDGVIRNIEQISRAKETYSSAAKGMVTCGIDGWRVSTSYVDDDSFDQDLVIEHIENFVDRVWFDPAAERQDKSDAQWVVVLQAISKKEYYARFPDGKCSSVGEGRSGEAYFDKASHVIIGELLYAKPVDKELILMSNGAVYEATPEVTAVLDELALLGITEQRRRTKTGYRWHSRFFDGADWLDDERETVFSRCPVVPVFGNYKVVENKPIYHGVVEKLIDPQRILNYSLSREIEEGALAPRKKLFMTLTQAAGFEDSLSTLNTNSDPVQFYNPDPLAQPPYENGGPQINPGLRTISEAMRQMIGMTAGMFAANMGDNPGLQSGVAIDALQDKGNNVTYKYFESMAVGIAATGRILIDAIPRVYTNARMTRLMYEDGTFEMAQINQEVIDQQTGQVVVLNDLSQGVYDVVVSIGPAFQNRQQETLTLLTELAKVDQSIMQLGGDVLLNAINSPEAKTLAERKRAQMVAQGLIPPNQLTEEERAQLAQQQAAQGQQQDPAMLLAQAEMMKAQAELSVAQTEQMKAQAALITAQARAQGLQIDAFEAETGRINAEVKAQEAGAKISKDQVETQGKQLDNAMKIGRIANPMDDMR
jgi:hypothetical protein